VIPEKSSSVPTSSSLSKKVEGNEMLAGAIAVGKKTATWHTLYVLLAILLTAATILSFPSAKLFTHTHTLFTNSAYSTSRPRSMASASASSSPPSQESNASLLASRIQEALQAHKRGELDLALSGIVYFMLIFH
jgi:hypothetical protein